MSEFVTAAIAGACIRERGPGGWAWLDEDLHTDSRAARQTTHERMELMAFLRLLEATDPVFPLHVLTASDYIFGHLGQAIPGFHLEAGRVVTGTGANSDLLTDIQRTSRGRSVLVDRVREHTLLGVAVELAEASAARAAELASGDAPRNIDSGPIVYCHPSTGVFHVVNTATGRCFCGLKRWPGVDGASLVRLTDAERRAFESYGCESCRRWHQAANTR